MTDMRVGLVITTAPGRRENLDACLSTIRSGSVMPLAAVVVLDGHDEGPSELYEGMEVVYRPKYEPDSGMEQPRNAGVRALRESNPELTHAWFLDSDILVASDALEDYGTARQMVRGVIDIEPVMIGPYDWLAPGVRERVRELHNDPRWAMFNERQHRIAIAELGVALGNFGGNLVWPIDEFIRIGGFHPQLHHGRCEDGELGLRAASHGVPMMLVPEARGWHLCHPVNTELALERNRRDVPLLNAWHPWVEEKGLVVTEADGARFDFRCECGAQVNTLEMWEHQATHA